MKKVSLKDVANSLGVSQTLVSFVINGKAKEKGISNSTAEMVMAKVKEMNYRPNSFARILRTGISKTIGVVVADISNPFYARIGRNIEDYIARFGYKVLFCSTDENADKEKEHIQMLVERGIDGIILAPTREYSAEVEQELLDLEIPVVLIDRYYPGSDFNYVTIDNYDITKEITRYLIENGHTRTGYLSLVPDTTTTMKNRWEGFLSVYKDKGLKYDLDLKTDFELRKLEEQIPSRIDSLLKKGVTAMISTNNKITIAAIYYMQQKGVKIPDDISLISFDYLDAFKILSPPLSNVRLFAEDIGDNAAAMIMDKIRNPKKSLTNVSLKAEFYHGKSVKKIK